MVSRVRFPDAEPKYGSDALMVGQRTVNPWLRQVGSIPTQPTSNNGVYSVVVALLSVKE